MKEIGLKLKLKREENGVSLEEAAADLKIRASQLASIEEGKKDDFKDVFSLKYFIRDYAKYLGLDGEEMLDDFNEYLFEQTSKISLEEIEEDSFLSELFVVLSKLGELKDGLYEYAHKDKKHKRR